MKKLIIVLAAFFTVSGLNAQKTTIPVKSGDILITPGIGVGSLKLGMNEAAAYKILKGDITWKNYKDEMKVFKSYGESNFAIDSIAQFILGFDSCAAYGGDLSEVMPVYSLYFDNHKLNYITVTSYGKPANLAKRVVLKNGIRFYDSMASCGAKMKSKYLAVRYEGYDGDHIYYKEGLEFTYDKKKLTTIGVFKPTPDFIQKMKNKSYDLQQEFGDVE